MFIYFRQRFGVDLVRAILLATPRIFDEPPLDCLLPLPPPPSLCLPVGRGKSNCREMHMEYYDLIPLNSSTWALVNGSSAI